MKGNGLSSTTRTLIKKANRQSNFASQKVSYLAAKEKQKSLLMQAEKAQKDRQAREQKWLAATEVSESQSNPI